MAVGFPVKDDYVTGDVLTAANMNDLSGTVNTLSSTGFAAGKNKIINGDFYINQRNFTSVTTATSYGFDRWFQLNFGTSGTCTYTPQTFTAGAAPVAGYEGKTFAQLATTMAGTDTNVQLAQSIEDVRTLAGSTATLSFWARATAGTPKILPFFEQNFGSGGSPSASVFTTATLTTISTTWTRYSMSIAIPSLTGKTIGTNANTSFLSLRLMISCGSAAGAPYSDVGVQSNTFQFWGVQLETGSTASNFQTATGTIQGELAACRRYLPALSIPALTEIAIGYSQSTNNAVYQIFFDVPARVAPTGVTLSGTFSGFALNTGYAITPNFGSASPYGALLISGSGMTITAGQGSRLASIAAATILFTGCEL